MLKGKLNPNQDDTVNSHNKLLNNSLLMTLTILFSFFFSIRQKHFAIKLVFFSPQVQMHKYF